LACQRKGIKEAVHPSIPQGERKGCAGAEFVLLEEGRFDISRELKPVVIAIGTPFALRHRRANGSRYNMAFRVYMLRCSDGSYYTGHTDDLDKRIAEHLAGEIPGYTSTRRPVELVFEEAFPTREEALGAELQIKGWSRKKKEAMIRGDWKEVQRLAWGTRNPLPNHLK
jgi:putative endonuclease